ncbi:type I 3-dehydroquinate dehydratase, partial [Streptococcus pyogenes]
DHVSGPGQVTLNDMKRIIEVLEMDISN